jgi:hypothetical protein
VELVAHRAGNDPAAMADALAVADTLELDVHLLRGRLDVRHSKVIWPFRIYWERGEGLLPDQHPPALTEIVDAVPDGTHLWIDLKGFTGRLPRHVLRAISARHPMASVTMSCRSWWALGPARRAGARTFRSVGNRAQRWLAVRLQHPDGIVLDERFATPDVLARLRGRCAGVAVWAVEDRARAEELDRLGVCAVIVDELGLIDDLRSSRLPTAPMS